MESRKRLAVFIAIIQSILWMAHFVLYQTWTFSTEYRGFVIKLVLGVLSISFIASSLLAFRYTNPAVRAVYKASAIWIGLLSFLFIAAVASWIIFGVARIAGLVINFHRLVEILFGAAVAVGICGVFNASW